MSDARGDPTGAVFRACRHRAGNADLAVHFSDELAPRPGWDRWDGGPRGFAPSHRLTCPTRPTQVWAVGPGPDPRGGAVQRLERSVSIQRSWRAELLKTGEADTEAARAAYANPL